MLVDEFGVRVVKVPDVCVCGGKYRHTNALDTVLCQYVVYCMNSRCRRIEVFYLA